jgi:hypothetical protein
MTIRKTRRTSDDENLTDLAIEQVIKGLSAEKPMTKKDACGILRIAYNTSRLDRIIAEFKELREADAKRRSEKRGKPASAQEINYIITEYMEGQPLDAISKGIYRGTGFIKAILEKYNVPVKPSSRDYFHPELIPDGAVRKAFKIGERVYSARYDSLATIKAEYKYPNGFVYRIWLEDERESQFAYQPAWELASLDHLREAGVTI